MDYPIEGSGLTGRQFIQQVDPTGTAIDHGNLVSENYFRGVGNFNPSVEAATDRSLMNAYHYGQTSAQVAEVGANAVPVVGPAAGRLLAGERAVAGAASGRTPWGESTDAVADRLPGNGTKGDPVETPTRDGANPGAAENRNESQREANTTEAPATDTASTEDAPAAPTESAVAPGAGSGQERATAGCGTCSRSEAKLSPGLRHLLRNFPQLWDDVARAPTLQRQLETFRTQGGMVVASRSGEGAGFRFEDREIHLSPEFVNVNTLAHEVGHSEYQDSFPQVSPEGLTRDQYIDKSLQRASQTEGYAIYNELKAQTEITQNGGADSMQALQDRLTERRRDHYGDGLGPWPKIEGYYRQAQSGEISPHLAIDSIGRTAFQEGQSGTTGLVVGDYYRDMFGRRADEFGSR
jgi:hypothetical protein